MLLLGDLNLGEGEGGLEQAGTCGGYGQRGHYLEAISMMCLGGMGWQFQLSISSKRAFREFMASGVRSWFHRAGVDGFSQVAR